MSDNCKFRVLLSFILIFAYGLFIVSGGLYNFSMWVASKVSFDGKAIFIALGVVSFIGCMVVAIMTARLVISQSFPGRGHADSKLDK